jgi:predicted HAD superfamily Cof-like phosphohydrolase
MRSIQEAVREFHKTFGLKIRKRPTMPSSTQERYLRYDLQEEELDELYEAIRKRDLVAVADALADSVYVAYGTDAVLTEVHASNMSKLALCPECQGTGKLHTYCERCESKGFVPLYHENGKVKKGPSFVEPDIKRVLDAQA